ncbi:FixH family protein [Antarcticimicrobium sediminis]|uniref:Nitrogen fixation protein FixH n=1 Tax=Antarcticimicrobium sediminis TaxID=2546227 RepID=A0A4R5ENT8_9RHOB|nr:FixH family protein [Antarcticimicrobium sediminis]TDE36272.1 nitrogen fixation protein FixH [Antarcticimicrobium sediminis]
MAEREFTGRHALMVFVGAFGVIIGVNLWLAYSAVSTFPGLEVANSYVASQEFDNRRAAQEALGWSVDVRHSGGLMIMAISDSQGAPVRVAAMDATIGRATERKDDVTPAFEFDGVAYTAPVELRPGKWDLRLKAKAADGTDFIQRLVFYVNG